MDLTGVTVIGMDEFAIRRGHRDATVVIEPARKRVLWVGRERSREGIRPFFKRLGPELETVVMDMNGAFEQEVRAQSPQAHRLRPLPCGGEIRPGSHRPGGSRR